MMMQYLKRILPFALTFAVGVGLGGFTGLFKSRAVRTEMTTTELVLGSGGGCDYKRRHHGSHRSRRSGARARTNVIATQVYGADSLMYEQRDRWQPVNVIYSPDPAYTHRARRNGTKGVVRLSVIFGADGKTKIEEVVSTLPDGLTEEATEAVRAIEFTPATLSGQPVSTHGVVDCIFELETGTRF